MDLRQRQSWNSTISHMHMNFFSLLFPYFLNKFVPTQYNFDIIYYNKF